MSRLSGRLRLSEINLPGTHDTCALHNGLSFGFAKCQTWQLADQLNAGIRYVDIRCRHVDNSFRIYHGVIDQKLSFSDVIVTCQKFLKDNPEECIVMSVKEESSPENNSRSFAETFGALTKDTRHLWHLSKDVPALDDVRGRIVVVDRVGTLKGFPWEAMKK